MKTSANVKQIVAVAFFFPLYSFCLLTFNLLLTKTNYAIDNQLAV